MEALRRMAPQRKAWTLFPLLLTLCAWVPFWLVAATTPPEAKEAKVMSNVRAAIGTVKQNASAGAAFQNDKIKKPLHDRNQYKYVELPNRLRAILISVPDCDRAAACLTVHVGAHQDPEEVPGTAHLLEHMIFLGSKKYPEQSDFSDFVWTNGGITNAQTGESTTSFFFEIRPDLLPEGLDRLSNNVASPLLEERSVNDEINAVDAEFHYRNTMDRKRLHMLLSHVPRLPHLAKFTTGNLESLLHGPRSKGIKPREVIQKHHDIWQARHARYSFPILLRLSSLREKRPVLRVYSSCLRDWVKSVKQRYSANLMTLAVAGKESVEDLEEMVLRFFGDIPNLDKAAPVMPQCSLSYLPFPSSVLETVTYVVPVADLHQAVFAFYIPPTADLLDTKPQLFISALLRHECPTCLETKLKNEGLISSMLVHVWDSESCSRIELVLNLTDKGSDGIDRIGELVFLYIRDMAVNPIDAWRWKELHDLQEIAFNYKDQPCPAGLVQSIATKVLYGDSYMYVFDKHVIASILEIMRPSNARVLLVDKKYGPKCTKTLSGYPVQYVEEPVSAATRELWYNVDVMSSSDLRLNMQKENMALPGPNPFIPTDLSLLKPPSHAPSYPELLKFTSEDVCGGMSCKIFFKQDTTFKVPKTSATLVFYYKNTADHHREALLFGILGACLEIILQQEMADATFAGYSFSVKSGVEKTSSMLRQIVRPNALTFRATGYSDKLPQVFQKGAAVVAASISVDDAQLVRYAEETTITPEELESWLQVQQRMTAIAVEGLIQGNIDSNEAKEMVNGVLSAVQVRAPRPYHEVCQYSVFDMHNVVPAMQTTPGRQSNPVHKDPSPIQLRYTIKNILTMDKQNAVTLYIQVGWPSLHRRALVLLAILWLRQKFFTKLRTEQQLGYIVAASTQTLERTRYLLFTVTSVHDVDVVSKGIEDFLKIHLETPLSQKDFEKIQKAGIELNEVKHKSLYAEAAFNFDQVVMREYMFDINEQLCEVLRRVSAELTTARIPGFRYCKETQAYPLCNTYVYVLTHANVNYFVMYRCNDA